MKFWFLEPFYGSLPCYRPRILVQVRKTYNYIQLLPRFTFIFTTIQRRKLIQELADRADQIVRLDSRYASCVRVQKVILFSRFNYFGVFALIVYKWQEGRLICIMHYVPDMSRYYVEYLGVDRVNFQPLGFLNLLKSVFGLKPLNLDLNPGLLQVPQEDSYLRPRIFGEYTFTI